MFFKSRINTLICFAFYLPIFLLSLAPFTYNRKTKRIHFCAPCRFINFLQVLVFSFAILGAVYTALFSMNFLTLGTISEISTSSFGVGCILMTWMLIAQYLGAKNIAKLHDEFFKLICDVMDFFKKPEVFESYSTIMLVILKNFYYYGRTAVLVWFSWIVYPDLDWHKIAFWDLLIFVFSMVNYMANWHFLLCFLYKQVLSILSDNFKVSSEYFAETISNQNTQLVNFTKLCQLSDTLDQHGHFLKRFYEILQSVNRFYGVSVTVIIIDFYLNSVIGFYYLYFLFINNWLFRDGKFSNSPFFYVTLLSVTDFISMCLSIYVYQSITIYSRNIKHYLDTTTNYDVEVEDRFERCVSISLSQRIINSMNNNPFNFENYPQIFR